MTNQREAGTSDNTDEGECERLRPLLVEPTATNLLIQQQCQRQDHQHHVVDYQKYMHI